MLQPPQAPKPLQMQPQTDSTLPSNGSQGPAAEFGSESRENTIQQTPTFRNDSNGERPSDSDPSNGDEEEKTRPGGEVHSPPAQQLEMRQNHLTRLENMAKSQEKPAHASAKGPNARCVDFPVHNQESSEPGANDSPAYILGEDHEIEPHASPTSLPVSQEKCTREERKSVATSNSGSGLKAHQPRRTLAGLRQQATCVLPRALLSNKMSSRLSHEVIDEESPDHERTPEGPGCQPVQRMSFSGGKLGLGISPFQQRRQAGFRQPHVVNEPAILRIQREAKMRAE